MKLFADTYPKIKLVEDEDSQSTMTVDYDAMSRKFGVEVVDSTNEIHSRGSIVIVDKEQAKALATFILDQVEKSEEEK